jgi:hypothetical protein
MSEPAIVTVVAVVGVVVVGIVAIVFRNTFKAHMRGGGFDISARPKDRP